MEADMGMPNLNSTQSFPTEVWNQSDSRSSRTGAFLYVIERAKEPEILAAIRAAHGGDIFLQPAAIRVQPTPIRLQQRPASSPRTGCVLPAALTRRETEVLRLLAQGNTNREAAEMLGLSVRTVENHRANLIQKLGVVGRAEIVRYAAEFDLI
jgi:DNA-binding NarL/FixJ family response regulator